MTSARSVERTLKNAGRELVMPSPLRSFATAKDLPILVLLVQESPSMALRVRLHTTRWRVFGSGSSAARLRVYPEGAERRVIKAVDTIDDGSVLSKGHTITTQPTTSRTVTLGERRRWYVHVALLLSLAGSLLSLIYLSRSITIHVIFGVTFMVMMVIHLFQRRRTITSLLKRLFGSTARTSAASRLAISDIILELLVLDVLVSGVVDALRHQATQFPWATALHIPPGLSQWHKLAAIVLVVYATIHIIRRRKRLRRSHIQ
jgi:hypothetical protein